MSKHSSIEDLAIEAQLIEEFEKIDPERPKERLVFGRWEEGQVMSAWAILLVVRILINMA